MEELRSVIEIDSDVEPFLLEHAFLVSLIQSGLPTIQKCFPQARFCLRKVNNYDGCTNCDPEEICLYIISDYAPADAFDRLRRVDDEWWLAVCDEAQGLFMLNMGFV